MVDEFIDFAALGVEKMRRAIILISVAFALSGCIETGSVNFRNEERVEAEGLAGIWLFEPPEAHDATGKESNEVVVSRLIGNEIRFDSYGIKEGKVNYEKIDPEFENIKIRVISKGESGYYHLLAYMEGIAFPIVLKPVAIGEDGLTGYSINTVNLDTGGSFAETLRTRHGLDVTKINDDGFRLAGAMDASTWSSIVERYEGRYLAFTEAGRISSLSPDDPRVRKVFAWRSLVAGKCGELAGGWRIEDGRREAGVPIPEIDAKQAAEICELAVRDVPDSKELRFWLSRALLAKKAYSQTLELLEPLAAEGYAPAQRNLGYMFFNGHGVSKDPAEARKWYETASEQDYAPAYTALGYLYHKGLGVERDDRKAVKLYLKAAAKNFPVAQYNLGWHFRNGNGAIKNLGLAADWYRKAADAGYIAAYHALGSLLWEWSQQIFNDKAYPAHPEFRKWEKRAIALQTEARNWFVKGAEAGDAKAQYRLGRFHTAGVDGELWQFKKALRYYEQAARQGHVEAQFRLGIRLWEGDFRRHTVDPDRDAATAWFKLAAEAGHTRAKYYLALAYSSGAGVSKDRAKAIALFREAASEGDSRATAALGYAYEKGNGVPKDLSIARAWFSKAAEMGNVAAKERLESSQYQKLADRERGMAILGGLLGLMIEGSLNRTPAPSRDEDWKAEWWCWTDFSQNGNPRYCKDKTGYTRRAGGLTDPCAGVEGWCDGFGLGGRDGFWK